MRLGDVIRLSDPVAKVDRWSRWRVIVNEPTEETDSD